MLMEGSEILETIYSDDFPIDIQEADILICENSELPEKHWVDYLSKRFPSLKIGVINYFSGRDEDFIFGLTERAKYVTFSTSFTDYGWFEKMLGCTSEDKKIIGYCADSEKWTKANEIAFMMQSSHQLEIVDNLR